MHIGTKPEKNPLLGYEIETKSVDYVVDWAAMGVRFCKSSLIMLRSWQANIRLSSSQESHRIKGGG